MENERELAIAGHRVAAHPRKPAGELLLERLAGRREPQRRLIAPTLVVRRTCGPARTGTGR